MTEKIDLSFRQHATRHQSVPNFSNRRYVTGQASSSATPIFRLNAAATVQWIYAQVSAACTIQLLFNGQPISAPYSVPASTLIRFPGLLVPNNSALALAVSAGNAQFEVAFVMDFKPELIVQEPAVYLPTLASTITSPVDAAGNVRINPTGNSGSFTSKHSAPAAGNNASLTVPAGKKWRFVAGAFVLTTSATVATRSAGLQVQDASANTLCLVFSAVTEPASTGFRYVFGPSLPLGSTAPGNQITSPFPSMSLGPGFVIASLIGSIQAGDTVVMDLNVEEYSD